jgi:hypothetical protein
MRIGWLVVLAGCGGAVTQTNPAPLPQPTTPQTYEIRMARDSHVGERSHVVLDSVDDTSTVSAKDGVELERKHEHKAIHLDAVSTIVAIDGKNNATRLHYEVASLTANDKPIFQGPVDLTRALKDADAVILTNGNAPEQSVHDALAGILSLRYGGPSDDDVFGTKVRQAVGARWPVNAEVALADMANDPKLRASSMTGETTLVGTTDCCLDVRSTVQLGGLSLPGAPGSHVDGHVDMSFQALFPTNVTRGRTEDHMTLHVAMKLTVPTPKGIVTATVDATTRKDGHFD